MLHQTFDGSARKWGRTLAMPTALAAPRRDSSSRERILVEATALFARYGFDGVSTREIANAAALNIATVAHHTGSKTELYLAVFERLHDIEQDLLAVALATPTSLHHLLDTYLDILAREPAIAALWTRRLLEPRPEHADIERRYVEPRLKQVTRLVARNTRSTTDPRLAVTIVLWAAYGHIVRSTVWSGSSPKVPKAAVRAIRPVLHGLVDHLLGLPTNGKPR